MNLGLQRVNEVLCYYCVTQLARNLGAIFRQVTCPARCNFHVKAQWWSALCFLSIFGPCWLDKGQNLASSLRSASCCSRSAFGRGNDLL